MAGNMEDKGRRVAELIFNGKTQKDALIDVGYAPSTASVSTPVIKSLQVDKYLQELREEKATTLLDGASKKALSDPEFTERAINLIEQLDDPEKKIKWYVKLSELATGDRRDLLDRAGVSKITKSMHLSRKEINHNDLGALLARKAELEEKRAGKKDKETGTI